MNHQYIAFIDSYTKGSLSFRSNSPAGAAIHNLDGFVTGPEGKEYRVIASASTASEAQYYCIPVEVPPPREIFYLTQCLAKALKI
jgi:hypothetical protein